MTPVQVSASTSSSPAIQGTTKARLDPAAVRRALREAGHRPRHALSQNFLADPDVLQAILDAARPRPGLRVLEIGPGLGILTGGLLAAGAAVTAVELDAGLAARLRSVYSAEVAAWERQEEAPGVAGTLHLVEGDILDQSIPELVRPPFEVVANLPYHITSPVLHRLLGTAPRPVRLVLMVQREVAERIAAPPGAMSYLSVFVQYHAAVRIAFLVPREAFEPAPAVDSAVIVLEPYGAEVEAEAADAPTATQAPSTFDRPAAPTDRPAPPFDRPAAPTDRPAPPFDRPAAPTDRPAPPFDRLEPAAEDGLWRLVQASFRERRKMLHNVLVRQLPVPPATVERALTETRIAGERRPQTLSVGEWLALHRALGPLPGDTRGRRMPRDDRSATGDESSAPSDRGDEGG